MIPYFTYVHDHNIQLHDTYLILYELQIHVKTDSSFDSSPRNSYLCSLPVLREAVAIVHCQPWDQHLQHIWGLVFYDFLKVLNLAWSLQRYTDSKDKDTSILLQSQNISHSPGTFAALYTNMKTAKGNEWDSIYLGNARHKIRSAWYWKCLLHHHGKASPSITVDDSGASLG